MAAKKKTLQGKGRSKQEAVQASYIRTGAHGNYRNRRVSIGRNALRQIEVYRKYYNMMRYELVHKIMGDWAQSFLPENKADFLDYQFSRPDEFSGFMAVMYDSDYEILESFSKIYGNRKAASVFAKIVDWWITENLGKSPLMGVRTKKPL